MLNDVTTTYDNDENDENDERGEVIIDRNNDDDGGVGSDVKDEPNKDDDRIQRVIYHGMGGTYNFFFSLYIR